MIGADLAAAAAAVFALVACGVIAFQVALALGAPWGAYAMGGSSPGRFPPPLRVAAVVQAVLIGGGVVIVLTRAGLAFAEWSGPASWLIWLVVVFSGVSLLLNAISPSAAERRIWTPVAAVMLATSLAVALSVA